MAEFGLGYCARGLMAGRYAIPIHDAAGALVAYAGRWVGAPIPEGEDKYKLPPRFRKNAVLYNLERAAALGGEEVVLVEGYFGAIRLHTLGLAAVALMGSSLSAAQLQQLARWSTVTVMTDGDEAGREAARVMLPMVAERHYVRWLALPEGEQPDTVSVAELRRFFDLA